jgi:hypothetical protein
VSDYNNVTLELDSLKNKIDFKYSQQEITSQAQTVVRACEVFSKQHSGITCKATVSYETKTINSSDLESRCNAVRKAVTQVCSSDFIWDYNNIITEQELLKRMIEQNYSENQITTQLATTVKACDLFEKNYSNVKCTAIIDSKETSVESSRLQVSCSKLRAEKDR